MGFSLFVYQTVEVVDGMDTVSFPVVRSLPGLSLENYDLSVLSCTSWTARLDEEAWWHLLAIHTVVL